MSTGLFVILALLASSMLLAAIRLVLGPTLADRVVALDLVAMAGIALIAIAAIAYNLGSLLDVAVLLGLVSFIGTAAFAHFIEKERG